MMNKKLIALFVAVATIGSVTKRCLADGFFSNLGRATGGLVEDSAKTVVNVPARLATGESVDELREDRENKPSTQQVKEQHGDEEEYETNIQED